MKRKVGLAFLIGGLAVALALAFLVSPLVSGEPDGLNRVAVDQGFADEERPHPVQDSPVAGYRVRGIENESLGTGLAGVIGVIATFALGFGLFRLLGRQPRERSETDA